MVVCCWVCCFLAVAYVGLADEVCVLSFSAQAGSLLLASGLKTLERRKQQRQPKQGPPGGAEALHRINVTEIIWREAVHVTVNFRTL